VKFRLVVILSLVIVASGCVNNSSNYEDSQMNYSEAKEKSTTVSYSNLLQYPEKHRGTFIEQEGRVAQVFEGGLLLHTRRNFDRFEFDINDFEGNLVWVNTQNNFSIYRKNHYLKVFGKFKGTKIYETQSGEYSTVPVMETSLVSARREADIKPNIETSIEPEKDLEPVKADKICVEDVCKTNVSNTTFRLEVGRTYTVNINDSEYGINVFNRTMAYNGFEEGPIFVIGETSHGPKEVVRYYVRSFPDAWNLLSSNIRVTGKRNTLDNRMTQINRMDSVSNYVSPEIVDIKTMSRDEDKAVTRVVADLYSNARYLGSMNTTVPLVKENDSWKLDRALNPHETNGESINLDINSSFGNPVYPSN